MEYILEGKIPKLIDDTVAWARWFESADRHVARTQVGELYVSTVFLGLDHNFHGISSLPILFETMIFGGEIEYQERYSTWEEAEKGHKRAVRVAKRGQK